MLRLILALCALVGAACACTLTARAGCDATGIVCESANTTGDCAAGDGFDSRSTTVSAGPASVTGDAECSYSSGFGSSSSTITASAAGVSVEWGSLAYDDVENGHFEGCFVFAGPVYESCPAALSPPDPGWGHLLP